MDVLKAVSSSINMQELSNKVCENLCSSIAVSLSCREDLKKCIFWDINGRVHENISNYLLEICQEIRRRFSVISIVIHYKEMVSNTHEPCIGVGCSAETYLNASQIIQCAFNLISDGGIVEHSVENDTECNISYPMNNNYMKTEEKLDFNSVPSCLIQINAGPEDVKRRIASFIHHKREQINTENKQDFCSHNTSKNLESDSSCARVETVFIRRNDSKSHLRIRKVHNAWGPQTRHNIEEENNELYENGSKKIKSSKLPHEGNSSNLQGLEERIKNVEDYIKLPGPIPSDVYTRLKKIEDRIIYMESFSPEYFQCWKNTPARTPMQTKPIVTSKKIFTRNELSEKIHNITYNT